MLPYHAPLLRSSTMLLYHAPLPCHIGQTTKRNQLLTKEAVEGLTQLFLNTVNATLLWMRVH